MCSLGAIRVPDGLRSLKPGAAADRDKQPVSIQHVIAMEASFATVSMRRPRVDVWWRGAKAVSGARAASGTTTEGDLPPIACKNLNLMRMALTLERASFFGVEFVCFTALWPANEQPWKSAECR